MDHGDGHGLTVMRQYRDGSRVVMDWTHDGDNRRLDAYRLTTDRRSKTETRVYLDGRKTITGPGFVTTSMPGEPAFTRTDSGLRQELLPDGRKIFSDSLTGDSRMTRTYYMRVHNGLAVPLRKPIVETYQVVSYQGDTLYAYVPDYGSDDFYMSLEAPLPHSFDVSSDCPDCLPSDIDFTDGAPDVSTPVDLLAAMQTSEGYEDVNGGDSDDLGPEPSNDVVQGAPPTKIDDDTQVAELQGRVKDLEDALSQEAARNQDLQNQLDDQRDTPGTDVPAQPAIKPHVVPGHIQKVIKKQILTVLELERAHKTLTLADLVTASDAKEFRFRVTYAIGTTDSSNGAACYLHTNNYIKFDKLPSAGEAAVRMKVDIASDKPNSCASGSAVMIKRDDLQEMLNDFQQRLDRNEKRVAAIVSKSGAEPPRGG